MENRYKRLLSRWGLAMVWVMGVVLTGRAQSPAPVVQWQRVLEGGDTITIPGVRVVAASNSGYALLAGKNVVRLSADGAVVWNGQLPGAYRDSSSGTVPVRRTIALAATSDSGFVVLAQDVFNRYYVVKLTAAGAMGWVKTVADANTGPAIRVTADALSVMPDGGVLVAGTFQAGPGYLALTRLSKEGYITGEWRIPYTDATQPGRTALIHTILNTTDGGYLLTGRSAGGSTSTALALKLDSQYKPVWQRTYPTLTDLTDVLPNSAVSGTYTAVGVCGGGKAQAMTIAPNGPGDGTTVVPFGDAYRSISLADDGAGNLIFLYGTSPDPGDFKLINLTRESVVRWTRMVGGSGNDIPASLLATRDGGYLAVGTTTSTDGDITGRSSAAAAPWIVKLGAALPTTTLRLQAPVYTCQTGAIAFVTTGGDGSPITYTAPGIARATMTANTGTVEAGLRTDPKPILIQATQNGKTVSYTFDLAAACPVTLPTSGTAATPALQLIAPTYNCQSGALTFRTTGGDGSPIEYFAAGVTDWTTNPNQYVSPVLSTAYSIDPLVLMARQKGQVVMYRLDLKAVCGRARMGADETASALTVSVLGNPTRDAVTVEVTGAPGQSLLMRLVDSRGSLVDHRTIPQAGERERQTFDVNGQAAGVLLLQTTGNGQTRTVKVLKQ